MLSKLGICSRTQAAALILAGRVSVDGRQQHDPERPSDALRESIAIDGVDVQPPVRTYVALNKPRGVVVTAADERGRDTIYRLLETAELPWLAPVGRLDKASEGLLLLCNDPAWAARITNPAERLAKVYHVQVGGHPDQRTIDAVLNGVDDSGEHLAATGARVLRGGKRNTWLEIVLAEGRNRHIRRMLGALGFEVLRLVRIAIGPIRLGDLPKGEWRALTDAELVSLGGRKGPLA